MTGQTNAIIMNYGAGAKLHAPTISVSGSTLTITNPAENGDFCTGYNVYKSGTFAFSVTESTVNLNDYFTVKMAYLLTARCTGEGMTESDASNNAIYRKLS
ncbi:MAG: hypothetical protein IJR55_05880 [Clostridia bacterium]|nr:hypothetical protein [Clostridia bacterium]